MRCIVGGHGGVLRGFEKLRLETEARKTTPSKKGRENKRQQRKYLHIFVFFFFINSNKLLVLDKVHCLLREIWGFF